MTIIKICGITTLHSALAAADAGADYLGFNFYPGSIRCIDARDCTKITAVLKAEHPSIRLVGVFVNAPLEDIQATMRTCSLDLAQLHGDESPEMLAQLGLYAYKAFRGIPTDADAYIHYQSPACLIDASVKGAYGGTGVTADWGAAAHLAKRHALFLAGGLNPHNAADAVRQVRPWGVDTASGVESRPGVKDPLMMKDFVQAVRSCPSTGSRSEYPYAESAEATPSTGSGSAIDSGIENLGPRWLSLSKPNNKCPSTGSGHEMETR